MIFSEQLQQWKPTLYVLSLHPVAFYSGPTYISSLPPDSLRGKPILLRPDPPSNAKWGTQQLKKCVLNGTNADLKSDFRMTERQNATFQVELLLEKAFPDFCLKVITSQCVGSLGMEPEGLGLNPGFSSY